VDNLFALVDGKNPEKALTFLHQKENQRDKGEWYLIRGKTMLYLEQVPQEQIIKKAPSLAFLAAFAGFNCLYDKNTLILIRAENQTIKDYDLHQILGQISNFIQRINIAGISNVELERETRIKQIYMIVDFGYPLPRDVINANIKTCKTTADYHTFVQRRLEMVLSVTTVYLTSWGELFCKTFSGGNNMGQCLNELGPQIDPNLLEGPNFFKVYIPCGRREEFRLPWLNQYIIRSFAAKCMPAMEKTAS